MGQKPKKCLMTIDWECWDSFRHYTQWKDVDLIEEPTMYLLDLLRRHQIKAIWYRLGWLEDNKKSLSNLIGIQGHTIGYHSYYHNHDPIDVPADGRPYRHPRWKGEKRLFSGGFWMRLMPYWWLKREVLKTGIFFVHPHDLLFEHPKAGGWTRQIGLKTSRDKIERLCRELEWDEPSKD